MGKGKERRAVRRDQTLSPAVVRVPLPPHSPSSTSIANERRVNGGFLFMSLAIPFSQQVLRTP